MFRFTQEDLEPYKGKSPGWGPVGAVTYKRTYSRPIRNNGVLEGREDWLDTCVRVIEGNLNLVPNDPTATKEWALEALDAMFHMAWLPPGRGLWVMGTEYATRRGGDALNNCWYISVRPQSYEDMEMFQPYGYTFSHPVAKMPSFPFIFMFDRAMLGGGVGFGVGKENVSRFPTLTTKVDLEVVLDGLHPDWYRIGTSPEYPEIKDSLGTSPSEDSVVLKVEDSREGW